MPNAPPSDGEEEAVQQVTALAERLLGVPALHTERKQDGFLASVPLQSPSYGDLGNLALLGSGSRGPLTESETETLRQLGSLLTTAIELRFARSELAASQQESRIARWEWNVRTGMVRWSNPAAVDKIFGYAVDDANLSSDWWTERTHPDDVERVRLHVKEALSGRGQEWEDEFRLLKADGEYAVVQDRAFIVRDQTGKPTRMLGSIIDVSEQRRIQAAFRESEQRYRLLFENHPHPLWVFDKDTLKFLDVNQAAIRAYGYSREEFLGMSVLDIRSPEERRRLLSHMQIESRPPYTPGIWRHRRKDGAEMIMEVYIHDVDLGKSGGGRLVLAFDVSERYALQQQLQQSQKMEAVGQLAGGIAHDFNNLLTIIIGHAELAKRRLAVTDPLFRELSAISNAGERAVILTQQLLAFSRRQVLEPKPVDIGEVISRISPMLRRLLPESILVSTSMDADPCVALVDPSQMEQVVINLAINARDAMPHGGHLTFEIRSADVGDSYTQMHPEAVPGKYVMLAVSDTGSGMPPEVQARVFDPFFTTKETGKGTGLGLSTVYGIVKQSGGHCTVYSEVGVGTTFKIYLPDTAADVRPEAGKREKSPYDGKGESILLVEDDNGVRAFIAGVLRGSNYAVTEAQDGKEASRLASQSGSRFDLLLTDVVLPGTGGPDIASDFERSQPRGHILFMSGYPENAITEGGIIKRGLQFLHKPCTPDELLRKVGEVLRVAARRVRVILADDEPEIRMFLRRLLEDQGIEVREAAEGNEAIGLQRADPADLLVTDLVMEGREGLDTIRAFRDQFPGVKVIAISGATAGSTYLQIASMLGAGAVLAKPVTGEVFLAAVKKALTR